MILNQTFFRLPHSMKANHPRLVLLATLLAATFPLPSSALPPWWQDRNLLVTTQTTDDFAAVNIGQLKAVASRAADEIRDRLPNGASPDIQTLIQSWATWIPSADKDDFAAVNIGQLKAVAKPFYTLLIANQVASDYPWSNLDPARDDFAAANVGQLKALFSFNLDSDTDGDYIRDVVEHYSKTNPLISDAHLDLDGDGSSNWNEILAGTPADSSLGSPSSLHWVPLPWVPSTSTTISTEPGLGSTISVASPATASTSQSSHALLRDGGFRFLIVDPTKPMTLGLGSLSPQPTFALTAALTSDRLLTLQAPNLPSPPPIPIRTGDVITIQRLRGNIEVRLNHLLLWKISASPFPQRSVPLCILSSPGSAAHRCQMTGLDIDSDSDGMADAWELQMLAKLGLPTSTIESFQPTADADLDSVTNLAEFLANLDASLVDSDSDGITDALAIQTQDVDGDGIPAGIEAYWGLSDNTPTDAWADLDSDGLSNLTEYLAGLSLNHPAERLDTDGDGMSDHFEDFYALNKLSFKDAVDDNDRDGVFNYEEAAFALDPFNRKTRPNPSPADYEIVVQPTLSSGMLSLPDSQFNWDADVADNWREHLANRTRHRAAGLPPPTPAELLNLRAWDMSHDHDSDGILTGAELAQNLNPLSADTDGDGFSDFLDSDPGSIESGYSPFIVGPVVETDINPYNRHFKKLGLTVQRLSPAGTWAAFPYSTLTHEFDPHYGQYGAFRSTLPLPFGPPDAIAPPIYGIGAQSYINQVNAIFRTFNSINAHPETWIAPYDGSLVPALYQRLASGTISIQRSSDFRVFSRIPPAKTAPLSRFWVWSAAFINPPPEAAPLHPLPLTPPATSLVEVNAGPTSDTATHLENAITFNESAGIGESLSQGLQHWPVPIGDVPTHIFKIPNATPGSDLVEAFPGVIPGVPFPYPLETVEHTDPENYNNITATHRPIVTISFRGTGGLRLWAIKHKGNPTLQENHQIFLSDATHQNDLIGLPSGPEVTYWIEPLTPGPITLTYRAKARHNPAELVKEFPINIVLLPIELAPEVLAVNTNFDEGDTTESHVAKPDCVNGTLKAKKDHLDGKWQEGDIVTEDLHQGFFGLRPGTLPYTETAGAVVKIKKLDKNDPETNRKQSGHVRLYAVRGSKGSESEMKIELYDKHTLVANDIGPQLYYQNPNTPVTFYLEGFEPGKITLEFSYQKGSTCFKHQQEFLVATKKSRAQWREEVVYQIRLQQSSFSPPNPYSDITQINPALGYRHPNPANDNSRLIASMYYYYAQLFDENQEKFLWPGMARVAASSIYAGMSDMYVWNTNPIFGNEPGAVAFVNEFMIPGAQAIFNDLAWSHRAYAASGIYAIKHLDETENGSIDFQPWTDLDDGIANDDMGKIRDAGGALLDREQNIVIQPYYAAIGPVRFVQPGIHYLWVGPWMGGEYVPPGPDGKVEIGEWLSANSTVNPIRDMGGDNAPLAFRAAVPGGRLDNKDHRWAWITHPEYGMLPRWSGTSTNPARNYSPAVRLDLSQQVLHDSAFIFTRTEGLGLPPW